jgi:hypothetical protein
MAAPGTPSNEEQREQYPDKHGADYVNPGPGGDVRGGNFVEGRFTSSSPASIACAGFAHTTTATATITLDKVADMEGGLVVTLTSSDPTKATIPASVTVQRDQISATVTVTGVAAGATTLTAAHAGMSSKTVAVTVS